MLPDNPDDMYVLLASGVLLVSFNCVPSYHVTTVLVAHNIISYSDLRCKNVRNIVFLAAIMFFIF